MGWSQNEVGAGCEQPVRIVVDARGDGDSAEKACRAHGLEDCTPGILLANAGEMDRYRRYNPLGGADRQAGHEFRVCRSTVLDLKAVFPISENIFTISACAVRRPDR